MTLLYTDPYKDNPFGKIKGDKKDAYLKANFDEAKFYKHENSYVLAGYFTDFIGVTRAYKPELGIKPSLVELPIYGSEYEIRQKKPGEKFAKAEYETITIQPSIAEKILYQHIEDNPDAYIRDGIAFKGNLTLNPDADLKSYSNDENQQRVVDSLNVEEIEFSGKNPLWTPPKSYSKTSYSSYSKGLSPQEKLDWLKRELLNSTKDEEFKKDDSSSLATRIRKVIEENQDSEAFLVIYFDLLKTITS